MSVLLTRAPRFVRRLVLAACLALANVVSLVSACSDDKTQHAPPVEPQCHVDADCAGVLGGLNSCQAAVCSAVGVCELGAAPDGTACSDGGKCTTDDACLAGVCRGTPLTCDDHNACTRDTCDAKSGCVYAPLDGTACDAGDNCTDGDHCAGGTCLPGDKVPGCCVYDAECDDDDLCTDDHCEDHACVHTPNQSPCDDGNPCTLLDRCTPDGSCAGTERACEDGSPCTIDACDPGSGACYSVNAPNGTACDDANGCTLVDTCQDALCVGTGNSCECVTDADCASFEDGNLCNGTLVCRGFVCVVDDATVVTCAGGSACAPKVCDPKTGQCAVSAVADASPCDDRNACTVGDHCSQGLCLGETRNCDDHNVCTLDACNPTSGCTAMPVLNGTSCADGTVCNGAETCQAGACSSGAPLACDDDNPCTVDACDATNGCSHVAIVNGSPCADATLCDGNETCLGGVCQGGSALDCNDNNPCTTDSCSPAGGCQHLAVANGTSCADANLCNGAESCQNGSCAAGTPLVCDDGNVCTSDSCVPATGCVSANLADGTACTSDNNACTSDVCSGGGCTHASAGTCNGPLVTCAADINTQPLATVALSGSGSDPDGGPVTYEWVVTSAPTGSTSEPVTPTAAVTQFFVDLAGDYTLTLFVTDGDGQTAQCSVLIHSVPPQDLHIELVWSTVYGDADLHLVRPGVAPASAWFSGGEDDCWYNNVSAAWPPNGATGNASLDIDDTDGDGPENINIANSPAAGDYEIGVEYFCSHSLAARGGGPPEPVAPGDGPTRATVRVYCGNNPVQEITDIGLDATGRWVDVASVSWPQCKITVKKTQSWVKFVQPAGYASPIHCLVPCTKASDCPGGEVCGATGYCALN